MHKLNVFTVLHLQPDTAESYAHEPLILVFDSQEDYGMLLHLAAKEYTTGTNGTNFVAAIKKIREITGLDLPKAKLIAEAFFR